MTETKRGRPPKDAPDRDLVDSLDQLEQQAKMRLSNNGRSSLTGTLNLTWTDKDPDYHYYWHSDSENIKITFTDLLNNGYEFVRKQYGSDRGEKIVKKRGVTNNYLMRIKRELHEENQAAHMKEIARKEQDLNSLNSREYGGKSTKYGEGSAVTANYTESPLLRSD
jgi:hypothetical protein